MNADVETRTVVNKTVRTRQGAIYVAAIPASKKLLMAAAVEVGSHGDMTGPGLIIQNGC